MSYQVLARKWRPQNFKQMVGQEHVLQALIHALDSQRLHHAYLFTGTRGVGKTTIGRILAKCLSCHEKITSEPCGQCGACNAISDGRYVDLIEIDAASRTKVEDMRELLENVQYAPTQGRFKIYLIDEVHMLSQSSFNALLKTLEEPPEHVKFLFATTDPQKLPVTILSRCLQFNLKNMPPEKIVSHLSHVLNEESVNFEDSALWALARAADGSMRDALSLTDQAIAYGNHVLSETGVSAMLGTVDQKKVYRILDALVHKEATRLLQEVRDLSDFSPDYRSVLASFSSILHRIALEQVVPGITDNSMGDKEQVSFYAQNLCAEDVQLFYQIALTSRQDLQISPDLKSGFEMALLRMLAFQLAPLEEGQRTDLNSGNVNLSETVSPEPTADEAETNSNMQPRQAEQASPQAEASEQVVDTEQTLIVEASTFEASDSSISQDAVSEIEGSEAIQAVESGSDSSLDMKSDQTDDQQYRATNESQSAGPISTLDANSDLSDQKKKLRTEPNTIPSGWNADVTELGLSGMTLNFLLNSVVEFQGDTIQVYVETGHYRLFNDNHEKRITEALLAFYSDYSHIVCVEGLKQGHETPMMWRERLMKERKEHARDLIFNDPYVDQIVQEFQANIIEQSIQPVDALK